MKGNILDMDSNAIQSPTLQLLVLPLFPSVLGCWAAGHAARSSRDNLQLQHSALRCGQLQGGNTYRLCNSVQFAVLKKFLLLHFWLFNLILQAEQCLASLLHVIVLAYLLCKIK